MKCNNMLMFSVVYDFIVLNSDGITFLLLMCLFTLSFLMEYNELIVNDLLPIK